MLGAQPSRAGDAAGCARALRLVRDMLKRRGAPTEWFQVPGVMPLLVAGNGPVLLVTYLDDPHPTGEDTPAPPPRVSGETASGAGVTRKAGVLAACGALSLAGADAPFTLVVEVDRHAGSAALDAWLRASGRRFSAALWEVVDLPIPVPTLFKEAFGVARMRVSARLHTRPVETLYAGVLSDAGHQLAAALAALKSPDLEVLLPRFYDEITPPGSGELRDVEAVSGAIGAWLTGVTRGDGESLSATHLALGVFCAPALFVREFVMQDAGAFIASAASATIEARIMPGQTPVGVARAITDFMQRRLPGAEVETLVVRPPALGQLVEAAGLGEALPVLPAAPGDTPAGTLEGFGISTAGYAVVGRTPHGEAERVALPTIGAGAALLSALGRGIVARQEAARP